MRLFVVLARTVVAWSWIIARKSASVRAPFLRFFRVWLFCFSVSPRLFTSTHTHFLLTPHPHMHWSFITKMSIFIVRDFCFSPLSSRIDVRFLDPRVHTETLRKKKTGGIYRLHCVLYFLCILVQVFFYFFVVAEYIYKWLSFLVELLFACM